MGYAGNLTATINLDTLARISPHSGYITKGDHNTGFDQPSNVSGVNGLITYDQIKSVAWFEIPWVGVFKMIIEGKLDVVNVWVPNTIPSLFSAILLVIFSLIGVSFLLDQRYYKNYRKKLSNDMNAPTPLFPVEPDKKK
jgi:signal peptidase